MLVVWFALPVLDDVVTWDIEYLIADLILSPVTNELVHGSPFPDVILEGINELRVGFHPVHVSHKALSTNE